VDWSVLRLFVHVQVVHVCDAFEFMAAPEDVEQVGHQTVCCDFAGGRLVEVRYGQLVDSLLYLEQVVYFVAVQLAEANLQDLPLDEGHLVIVMIVHFEFVQHFSHAIVVVHLRVYELGPIYTT